MGKRPLRIMALSLLGIAACKLVVLLLLLRLGYVRPFLGDNAIHIYLPAASHIVATGAFNDRSTLLYSSQAPGYSFFIALVQRISPHGYLFLIVCLQTLLDLGVAFLLLFLGDRMTSVSAGWLAGVLWLVFPPAVIISTWITAETLFTFLLALSMVLWLQNLSQEQQHGGSFAAGLALGAATLVRGTTQLLPFVFLLIPFSRTVPSALRKCALLFAGACLLILPWSLRNLRVLGEPMVVQTGFGTVFLQGSASQYFTIRGKKENYPALFRQAAQEGLAEPKDKTPPSLDHWRFRLGLRNYRIRLQQNPLSFFPFLLHKFVRLWYGAETGSSSKSLILGLCSLAVVPIGLFQIWVWRRDRFWLSLTLGILVEYFIFLHLVAYPEFRYMFPIYPFIIFAASHQYLKLVRNTALQEYARSDQCRS